MYRSAEPILQNPFNFEATNSSRGEEEAVGGHEMAAANETTTSQHGQPPALNFNMPCLSSSDTANDSSISTDSRNQTPEETVILEGESLFNNFIREEIVNEGLQVPEELSASSPIVTGAAENNTLISTETVCRGVFAEEGRRLREIADDFSESQERRQVRQLADNVNFSALNRDNFMEMLNHLFDNQEITLERIVVLFFYCRDLAIRALRARTNETFTNFIRWSIAYITRNVCHWVYEHGGWGRVLQSSIGRHFLKPAFLITLGAVFAIAGIILHFRRNA